MMERESFSLFLRILFTALLAVFILSLLPILFLGFYAVPAADDFSYGAAVYQAIQNGAGLPGILAAAFHQISVAYEIWQGTHSAVFLMSLQPAVFGERFYALTPFIMLFSLCGGLFVFCRMVFFHLLQLPKRLSDCIWLFCSILCIQLAPSPIESFFWYNGSVYYTFFHGMLLCMLSLCFLYIRKQKKSILLGLLCLLGITLGGGNYVTALQTAILGVTGIVLLAIFRRREWKILLLPLLLFFISFLISVKAPGNAVRQNSVEYTPNALHAIFTSFYWGAKDSLRWMTPPVLAVLIFLFPLFWTVLSSSDWFSASAENAPENKEKSFLFRYPGLLTIYSYCLLSAMYCPPYYAMDGIPERAVNIIYYSFVPLLVLNEIWWIGWYINKKGNSSHDLEIKSGKTRFYRGISSYKTILLCTFVGLILCAGYLFSGKASRTSALALHDLRSGDAQAYHAVYEERFKLLHDDSVQNVVMEPNPWYPVLICGGDFSEDPDNWTNHSLATYYGKESVVVSSVP